MFVIEFKGEIASPALGIDDFPPLIIQKPRSAMAASVSGPADMTVMLPVVIANSFEGKGSNAGATTFTLELAPPDADVTQITFTGINPASQQDVLATQIDGVGIELLDELSRRVSIGSSTCYPAELPFGSRLRFSARYIQTVEGEIASGNASAMLQVEVKYLKFVE